MDANLIHDIIFYVMYAALAIAVVILVNAASIFRGPSVRLCALKRR
ncbi:Ferric siderophore transport system [Klebsiella michiganensis]|nr:Ferric siderophore transport system [Klebsiella michiganensis]